MQLFILRWRGTDLFSGRENVDEIFILFSLGFLNIKICDLKKDGLRNYGHGNHDHEETSFGLIMEERSESRT